MVWDESNLPGIWEPMKSNEIDIWNVPESTTKMGVAMGVALDVSTDVTMGAATD